MGSSKGWSRWFISITMFVYMVAMGSASEAALAAYVDGNTYTSPRFGYSITFNDSWYVSNEESTTEYDAFELTNGVTVASLFGAEEAGGSAVIEFAFMLSAIRTDPTVSDFETVEEDISPERATGTYRYTFTEGAYSIANTLYLETRTIEAGTSVLIFLAFSPTSLIPTEAPLVQELASSIVLPNMLGSGEPAPVFVSGQWRIALAGASRDDEFNNLGLKPKDGKQWLILIADVTNWSSFDGTFIGREVTVQPGLDGKIVKAAPGSTKSVATRLELEAPLDELTVPIPANQTKRVALVYTVPANSSDLTLVLENAILPLEDKKPLSRNLDLDGIPATAAPPLVFEGEFVSASDGRSVRVQFAGEADSQRLRLLGVKPPADSECYADEAKEMLGGLAGQRVIVEEDANVSGASNPRYVWLLNADGTRTLLNQLLISTGLATVDKIPASARFGAWLRGSQMKAEAESTGLWHECVDQPTTATEEAASAENTKITPTIEATETTSVASAATVTTVPLESEDGDSSQHVIAETTFDIYMGDMFYSDAELVVPANSVITIHLTSVGFAKHTFNIDELDIHTGEFSYGEERTVTFRSGDPGTMVFYCNSPGHSRAGMTGKIIVIDEVTS